MTTDTATHYCLNLACGSARGQVAAVSQLLDAHGAYIEQFSVFDDHTTERFYVRGVFSLRTEVQELRHAFGALAHTFPAAQWQVHDLAEPTKVLIMVSKFDHCLRELIAQWRRGELKMNIVGIVSNHPDLANIAHAEGLPYHHLPITADTKPAQEAKLERLIADTGAEFVVLARYMQVLSEDLCQRLHGRVINIHHSFLPGFKGGRPYQQAFDRGVKLIGATAHFATTDLDEGPIIEQSVERVDHADTPQHLSQAGRLVESLVLSRALRFVLERRVFINGMKTVVLR
ncbi:formyltetrahydrofolate deformylase [Rhodoferax aquaticus]|uniref:Formyltetrahydrofolate deformylase n=1 Tax=Rhodoferax aquaticus TaxID=2527691 RepID=A0A515ETC2_9BURK|nr:formyltetrahydrofolate deformylase [Rhodoferax aquaticus]QDL55878.1 formyltetrahydrofolate deformylase [Rhodoferax aquaticus]